MKTTKLNLLFVTAVLSGFPSLNAADKPSQSAVVSSAEARRLAVAAFKDPSVPFQGRLILTEWKDGESKAEEVNLSYMPGGTYRVDFLGFDGTVKRTVILDGGKKLASFDPEPLLGKNYSFQITGSETFIGVPVWNVQMTPHVDGKPIHELKIEKATNVVLEHRRYLPGDKVGSLTRFSTFQTVKSFPEGTFTADQKNTTLGKSQLDGEAVYPGAPPVPPADLMELPAGFTLNNYNVFEVAGTTANHFYYSDGALPLSVFETKLPVQFPTAVSPSEKIGVMLAPSYGLSGVDHVAYGKKGANYITIVGEVSPTLLRVIAQRFN